MDQLFKSLKGFTKLPEVSIDNLIFQLHYKVTVPLLIAFSIMVTSRQYIGDPISCISNKDNDIPDKVLDTFCWVHATFSLEGAWEKKVGVEVPYPGVDKYKNGEKKVYHAYYQWVCFVLFFQSLLFYVPRYFWKSMESNRIKSLAVSLKNPIIDSEKRYSKCAAVIGYLYNHSHRGGGYYRFYLLAEVMNATNVLCQMYLMDVFLGGEFSDYGVRVIEFSEWDWNLRFDPMIRVFPRLTKCSFYSFGSSGDVRVHDSMCILPINILNEKIYIFLWFWFVLLAVLSCFAVVYRVLLCVFPPFRYQALKLRSRLVRRDHFFHVMRRFPTAGDWLVFNLLAKNIDAVNYKEVFEQLDKLFKDDKV